MFLCDPKSFGIVIIFFFFFFLSTANLDRLTKFACYICSTRWVWLSSNTLEKCYMTNIYFNLKFRVWKYDMPCASEKIIMALVSAHISDYVNIINIFHDVNSQSFTRWPIFTPTPGFYQKDSMFSLVKT